MANATTTPVRWTWGLWPVLAVLLIWQPNFQWTDGPREKPYGSDFLQDYAGAHVLLRGDTSRLYDVGYFTSVQKDPAVLGYEAVGRGYYPPVYPPWWYAVQTPLATIPLRWAAPAWLAALCLTWFLALRWCLGRDEALAVAARSAPLLLLVSGPLLLCLALGQKSLLLASILLVCATLLREGRVRTAGAVLGLLVFKPHLMLLLAGPLVLRYGLPMLTGGLLTVLAAVGLATAIDPTLTGNYIGFLAAEVGDYAASGGYDLSDTHNWSGLWARLFGFGQTAWTLNVICTAATLALMAAISLRRRRPPSALEWTAWVTGAVLASPHFYSYDLLILVVPAVFCLRDLVPAGPRRRFAAFLLWLGLTILPQTAGEGTLAVQWSAVILAGVFVASGIGALRGATRPAVTGRPVLPNLA